MVNAMNYLLVSIYSKQTKNKNIKILMLHLTNFGYIVLGFGNFVANLIQNTCIASPNLNKGLT